MKHWFKDHHFRELLKNSSYLACSQIVAAAAGLVTLSVTGRNLGLVSFGLLVLIHSYVQAAGGLTRFQSWQVVVRYGGKAMTKGQTHEFEAATRFAIGLDLASGLVGMAGAIALLPLIGGLFGIPGSLVPAAMVYCALVPNLASAAPLGVLRSLDRFDLLAWQETVAPICRALLVLIASMVHAHFRFYLAAWFASAMLGDIYLWFLAWRELKRHGLNRAFRPSLRAGPLRGGWRFAIQVNLNATLATAAGPIGRLIVGAQLGPASAALHRVASVLTTAVQKPADLLLKAYYPQVVRMDFASAKPWKLMFRSVALTSVLALCAFLLLVLAGPPIIRVAFGAQFAGAYAPLLVLAAVPLIGMTTFPVGPMLYSLNRADAPVHARLVGTILYLLAVVPSTWAFGLIGAAAAFVLGNLVTAILMLRSLGHEYRRVRNVDGVRATAHHPQ